jgi:two-component system chemotaxis response regulator CheB
MIKAGRKIKVLVVDDSLMFREVMAKGIGQDPNIEMVITAGDPFEAKEIIEKYAPDVITLDVEMPKMNGIEFLKSMMPQYPLPVIVVSAVNQSVFEAIKYGAVDFVSKPQPHCEESIQGFIADLVLKIRVAATAKVRTGKNLLQVESVQGKINKTQNRVIAIGASTGGTEAVLEILKTFSPQMPPTLVVQHMPPVFTKLYAERINDICEVEVREAKAGDRLYRGLVLIAPGMYHLSLKRDAKGYFVDCFEAEKVNGHCPSVDVLFKSVADCCGSGAIGVILTGMGQDGAAGLLEMKKKGAKTIGQNEETAVVYGMPKVAFEIGAVEKQAALNEIPQLISSYLSEDGSRG